MPNLNFLVNFKNPLLTYFLIKFICLYWIADLENILNNSIYRREDTGMWHCNFCDLSSKKSSNVKNHVESKHIRSGGFGCKDCETVCPTRKALKMHEFRRHRDPSLDYQSSIQFS